MIEHGDVYRYEQLAHILRRQIEAGEIPPRSAIPPKRELRRRYGVSGGTVDRAVDLLRQRGMVRTVKGLGIFVTPPGQWEPGP